MQQEFGVTPQQLPNYWGLAGISSSKIPGMAGIEPKIAVSLLQQMGSLDELYRQLQHVSEK